MHVTSVIGIPEIVDFIAEFRNEPLSPIPFPHTSSGNTADTPQK